MTPKRYQVSTSISPATWYQIQRLATEYGTQREVITRAVELLDRCSDVHCRHAESADPEKDNADDSLCAACGHLLHRDRVCAVVIGRHVGSQDAICGCNPH